MTGSHHVCKPKPGLLLSLQQTGPVIDLFQFLVSNSFYAQFGYFSFRDFWASSSVGTYHLSGWTQKLYKTSHRAKLLKTVVTITDIIQFITCNKIKTFVYDAFFFLLIPIHKKDLSEFVVWAGSPLAASLCLTHKNTDLLLVTMAAWTKLGTCCHSFGCATYIHSIF